MKGHKGHQAAIEAREEAGIVGRAHEKPVGPCAYGKRQVNRFAIRRVEVFLPEFRRRLPDWREKGQRRGAWLWVEDAMDLVDGPGLRTIPRDLSPRSMEEPASQSNAKDRSVEGAGRDTPEDRRDLEPERASRERQEHRSVTADCFPAMEGSMPEPIDVQPPSDVEGGMQAYRDASAEIQERAGRERLAPSPSEARLGEMMSGHALNLAVAAFTGYALATLIHRRPAHPEPAAPLRPVPRPAPQTSYRGPSQDRDSRASIRYR